MGLLLSEFTRPTTAICQLATQFNAGVQGLLRQLRFRGSGGVAAAAAVDGSGGEFCGTEGKSIFELISSILRCFRCFAALGGVLVKAKTRLCVCNRKAVFR